MALQEEADGESIGQAPLLTGVGRFGNCLCE